MNLEEKYRFIMKFKEENKSIRAFSTQMNISPTTAHKIISNSEEICKAYEGGYNCPTSKRRHKGSYEQINIAVNNWYNYQKSLKMVVTGLAIRQQGLLIAKELGISKFCASNGWLERLKKRFLRPAKYINLEIGENVQSATHTWQSSLQGSLVKYEPKDIFTLAESHLLYRGTEKGTLSLSSERLETGERTKSKLSVVLSCNLTGSEKLNPYVIGNCFTPDCFGKIKPAKLGVDFSPSKHALLTQELFQDYLGKLDKKFLKEDRKVLVIAPHSVTSPQFIKKSKLKTIELLLFPPNKTVLQPMGQGIMHAFRARFKSAMMNRILNKIGQDSDEPKKVLALDSLHMINTSWEAVSPLVIQKSWEKTGISLLKGIKDTPDMDIPHEDFSKKKEIRLNFKINKEKLQRNQNGPKQVQGEMVVDQWFAERSDWAEVKCNYLEALVCVEKLKEYGKEFYRLKPTDFFEVLSRLESKIIDTGRGVKFEL